MVEERDIYYYKELEGVASMYYEDPEALVPFRPRSVALRGAVPQDLDIQSEVLNLAGLGSLLVLTTDAVSAQCLVRI